MIAPPGSDPEGTIVVFNRGDGAAFSLRAGAGGRYRAEPLLPGGWQVRSAEEDLLGYARSMSSIFVSEPMEWDCTVVDGHTKRFDLDLSARVPVQLSGQLGFAGLELEGWSARLEGDGAFRRAVALATLAPDGSFELEAPAGSYRLLLAGPVGAGGRLELTAPIALEPGGTNEWSRELSPSTLAGSIDVVRLGAQVRGTLQAVAGAEDLSGELSLDPGPKGAFGPLILPAGTLRLFRTLRSEAIASRELVAGGTQELVLP